MIAADRFESSFDAIKEGRLIGHCRKTGITDFKRDPGWGTLLLGLGGAWLASIEEHRAQYERLIEVFQAHDAEITEEERTLLGQAS